MDIYDFFNEKIKPYFKDEYVDFSSKNVDGYALFVSEYKSPYRQAMATDAALEQLQAVDDAYQGLKKDGVAGAEKSQIGRWYVNGFTAAYNFCRRYDKEHPYENVDYAQLAQKLKPTDDLAHGDWTDEKFRRHTILLGRYEGTLFYQTEREQAGEACGVSHEDEMAEQDAETVKFSRPRGRVVEPFSALLMGSDQKKEQTLQKLHELLEDKRGKKFALVITCAIEAGLIHRPSFKQLVAEFGSEATIGSENSVMKQIGKIHYTQSEYNGMMKNFEPLRAL